MATLIDRLSPELQILVLAMRHVSRNGGRLDFRKTGNNIQQIAGEGSENFDLKNPTDTYIIPEFDSKRLLIMAAKHRLRPILLEFDRYVGFLDSVDRTRLEAMQLIFVRQSLTQVHALQQVIELLKEHGIDLIPMKGNLLIQELYNNNQLRESGDIDFLLKREHVVRAVHLLKKLGYELRSDLYPQATDYQDQLVQLIVGSRHQSELPLSNGSFSLDVHWGISQPYYGLPLSTEQLFERAEHRPFFGANTLMPSLIDTWWMTMIHHGGKEFWKSFRHILELDLFEQKLGQESPETVHLLEQRSQVSKLTDTLSLGRALVSELIDDHEMLSPDQRKRTLRHLIPLWEAETSKNSRNYWFHEVPMRWYSRPSVWTQVRMVPDVVRSMIDTGKLMRYPEPFGSVAILKKTVKLGQKIMRGNE